MTVGGAVTWLFVPGSRPDRFDKAASAGADEVVLDLEDAVAPGAKDAARDERGRPGSGVAGRAGSGSTPSAARSTTPTWRRWPAARVCAAWCCPRPRTRRPWPTVRRRAAGRASGLLALVETAVGIDRARAIATGGAVDRLALGAVDFALDLGADETDEALLLARSHAGARLPTGGSAGPGRRGDDRDGRRRRCPGGGRPGEGPGVRRQALPPPAPGRPGARRASRRPRPRPRGPSGCWRPPAARP